MKKLFKALSLVMLAAVLAVSCLFGGCFLEAVEGAPGINGKDGADGKDLSIYDIYQAVNDERQAHGEDALDFLDFVREYLSYNGEEIESELALQAQMNRSLFSGVSIITKFDVQQTFRTGYFGYQTYEYNELYVGSGVIIDVDRERGDAVVVTNAHVIYDSEAVNEFCQDIHLFLYGQDTQNINYTVSYEEVVQTTSDVYYKSEINDTVNGYEYGMKAEIIGVSLSYDIAVLKVEGSDVIKRSNAVAAKFTDSERTYVGEEVYAIGFPSGDGMTLTSGRISKDSEYIQLSLTDSDYDANTYLVLRTDAAINGGNSGGGLFNSKGEIIGIVNAKNIVSTTDNVGYALPAGMVKRVVQSMLDNYNGSTVEGVYKATMGITYVIANTSAELTDEGTVINERIVVNGLVTGGMAYDKLKVNDVILKASVIDGEGNERDKIDVNRDFMLTSILLSVRSGDTLRLTVERDKKEITVDIKYTASDLELVS